MTKSLYSVTYICQATSKPLQNSLKTLELQHAKDFMKIVLTTLFVNDSYPKEELRDTFCVPCTP